MDDILQDIESSNGEVVHNLIELWGIEYCFEYDTEDLRALTASFILSNSREEVITKELQALFPESSELLTFLFESTNYLITEDLLEQLLESSRNPSKFMKIERKISQITEKYEIQLPLNISKTSNFIVIESKSAQVQSIQLLENKIGISVCQNLNFGCYKCKVMYNDNVSCNGRLFVTSPTYTFLNDCDIIFDVLINGWNPNISNSYNIDIYSSNSTNGTRVTKEESVWSNALENSLLEILVYADDELQQTLKSWKHMMSTMSSAFGDETENLFDMIKEDITKALSQQSSYAIGRLHQNLLQLVDTGGGFLNLPQVFVQAVHTFLEAKINASPRYSFLSLIDRLIVSIPEYLQSVSFDENNSEKRRLYSVWQIFQTFRLPQENSLNNNDDDTSVIQVPFINYDVISAVHNLRPRGMELVMPSSSTLFTAGMSDLTGASVTRSQLGRNACYLPTIPLNVFENLIEHMSQLIKYDNIIPSTSSINTDNSGNDHTVTSLSSACNVHVISDSNIQYNQQQMSADTTTSTDTTISAVISTVVESLTSSSSSSSSSPYTEKIDTDDLYEVSTDNNVNMSSITCAVKSIDDYISHYSECLGMDVINIQGILGYTLGSKTFPNSYHNNNSNITKSNMTPLASERFDAMLISSLLNSGLEYVASSGSGKLMSMLHMNRAVLILNKQIKNSLVSIVSNPLSNQKQQILKQENLIENEILSTQSILPPSLEKRRKDMPRIFRNKLKSSDKLSLRLNTDFDGALSKLRMHHGTDCWIGTDLEKVWRCMFYATPPQLLIFELWYNDVLIAADFSHPCCYGRSVYVATRFYHRGTGTAFDTTTSTSSLTTNLSVLKHLQPGFLLALAETKQLQDYGVYFWDLGGVNICQLMLYKYDLTGAPISRPQFLSIFREVRDQQFEIQMKIKNNMTAGVSEYTSQNTNATTVATNKTLSNLTNNMVLVENLTFNDLIN